MKFFIMSLVLMMGVLSLISALVYQNLIMAIVGFLAVSVIFLIVELGKYKSCNIEIYINGKPTNNLYYANIKELISPEVYLNCIDEGNTVKNFNITNSMILVSEDPMVAKVLPSGGDIKVGTFAEDCKIFIKHKNHRFWKFLKKYKGLELVVKPDPPYILEIVEIR